MKLKAPQNKWFLAFVATAVVAAIAIVLAIIGLIPKQPEDISYVEGPETGVYYYDVVEGEVQLTLSGGCNFAIAGPWINKTGTYTVGEVAEAVGISDIKYFSKLFKRYAGVSPSTVKKYRFTTEL